MTDALDPRWRRVGDPEADELVRRLAPGWQRALSGEARNVDRSSNPSLAAFFETHAQLPADTRYETLDRATRWCDAHLPYLSIGMLGGSLPLLFLGSEGAQVLTGTGALVEQVDSRINRTGRFVLDVTEPGGTEPEGRALRAAVEVRLVHALVRANAQVPHPICQQDMVVTLLAFAVMPIRCARRLGVSVSTRDAADHYALWCAVAPALGVHAPLLPRRFADAEALLNALVEANAAPSDAGRLLAAALLDGIARHLAVPGRKSAAAWLVRYLLDERSADLLSIPPVAAAERRKWTRLSSTDAVSKLVPMLGRAVQRRIVDYKLRG